MSNAASNYLENAALKWALTADAVTRPTTWYIGLFTSDPTDAGSGTEVTGGSYERTAVSFSVTADTATNSASVTFPTATGDWGLIGFIGVYDAQTSGNLLFHGAVAVAKSILSGDTFQISTGNLSITLA
jgi:hypothetical protein